MIRIAILLFIFSLNTLHCHAWGAEGHRIIASIAYDYLDSSVKDSINKYLAGTSIQDASVWMDEIRNDRSYDYMKPMHYVNIEPGKEYQPSDEVNIINKLEEIIQSLKSKNQTFQQRHTNLKILLHLIGDLHQPLHTGYKEDKGGNTVQVTFFGKGTNLHRLWDTELIENSGLTKDVCLTLLKSYSKDELERIKRGNTISWARESRSYLPSIYNFKDNRLGKDYMTKNMLTAEKQILLAGLRLASLLNIIFQ